MTDDRSLSVNFSEFSSYTFTSPLACSTELRLRMNGAHSNRREPLGRPSCVSSLDKDGPSTECLADMVKMYCRARIDALRSPLSRSSRQRHHRSSHRAEHPYRISLRLIFVHRSASDENRKSTGHSIHELTFSVSASMACITCWHSSFNLTEL